MVDPARALPGRKEKMRISATHYVLKTPMEGPLLTPHAARGI